MAKLFGRLNNLSYRGGETETANVVIDGGVIKVDVIGSPQDVTGAYIIGSTLYIKRASADTLELPLLQPNLAETDTESLAFVKNKKISYLENDTGYITAKDADKTYIKKITVNGTDVPILSDGQVAQILIGEGLSVGANAIISVDTSKIATNEYVDSNTAVVTENITQHKNDYNNPHKVTKAQVGLDKVDNTADIDKPISTATQNKLTALQNEIETHIEDGDNPHQVTAEQIGLGNVDNTSDLNKPISTATQTALNKKVDRVEGKGLSTEDFTTELKNKLDGVENGAQVNTITGVKGDTESEYRVGNVNITKENIGLGNVDNTSDMDKLISTAQQEALDKKLDKSGGTITGDLAVQGNLTVSGTITSESQKQLLVEDNVIVTNANKIDLKSLLSGIAINKHADATYGIMYDPSDDTVKFGQGTFDENNEFKFNTNEGLPIAIRAQASHFTDAHLIKWDATKNAFVDAGYTGADIASKTDVTVNGKHVDTFNADKKLTITTLDGYEAAYTVNNSTQMTRTIDTNHNSQVRSGNIATYANRNDTGDTNPEGQGVLITSYPKKNYQCANKEYVDNTISSATSITILEASDA